MTSICLSPIGATAGRSCFAILLTTLLGSGVFVCPAVAEVNQVERVEDNVFFHEGDVGRRGHCNNGWIVFEDFVLVVDGNFPSGAQEIIPKIAKISDRPVRFVVDTHHHGDHAYGNQLWFEHGATLVASVGALDEMKKFETGYFGDRPGRWEDLAKNRPDVAATKFKPPTLVYERLMVFEDRRIRAELRHLGVAHTRGDTFVWLPRERILFTGDACVNGPYNSMGDGDTGEWVKTLEAARQLKPKSICPGHGARGGPEVLEHQITYLTRLRAEVRKLVDAGAKPSELKAAGALIKEALRKDDALAFYIGTMFDSQVEKIYAEMNAGSASR